MIKRVYFDHAAATPVDLRVQKAMEPYWSLAFANPSAIHKEGVLARKAVEGARRTIATLLGIHADEIVFTGSATESCNLALFGAVTEWKKNHPDRVPHVIVSMIEHDAILEPARKLEKEGVRVTRLPVDAKGIVDITMLKKAIDVDTVLVSIMYVNNEIGAIQPIAEIAKIIRKWKKEKRGIRRDRKPEKAANFSEVAPLKAEERPQAASDARYPLFHTDATQAANYCDMSLPRLGVNMLTMNAAKIYGPKGIGLLAILRGTPIAPIIVGGGHEGSRRAGTENVPTIIGFAEAFRLTQEMAKKESERLIPLRDYMISELKKIPGLVINGDEHERLSNNVNFSIPQIDHEFLAFQLDARGFAVATKSACNETDAETSHVLAALSGADGMNDPTSGIRISLGRTTLEEDVDMFLSALREITMKATASP